MDEIALASAAGCEANAIVACVGGGGLLCRCLTGWRAMAGDVRCDARRKVPPACQLRRVSHADKIDSVRRHWVHCV